MYLKDDDMMLYHGDFTTFTQEWQNQEQSREDNTFKYKIPKLDLFPEFVGVTSDNEAVFGEIYKPSLAESTNVGLDVTLFDDVDLKPDIKTEFPTFTSKL